MEDRISDGLQLLIDNICEVIMLREKYQYSKADILNQILHSAMDAREERKKMGYSYIAMKQLNTLIKTAARGGG